MAAAGHSLFRFRMNLKTIIRWCRYLNYVAAFSVFVILGSFMRELWSNSAAEGLSFNFTSIIFSIIRWFILPVLSLLGMETLKIIIFQHLPRFFIAVGAYASPVFIATYTAGFRGPSDMPFGESILFMVVLLLSVISLLNEDRMVTIEVLAAYVLGSIIYSVGEFPFLEEKLGVPQAKHPRFLIIVVYHCIRFIRRVIEPKCRSLYNWANTEHGFHYFEIAAAKHRHLE